MGSAQESMGFSYNQSHSKDSIDPSQKSFLTPMYADAARAARQNTVADFTPYQLQAQQMGYDTALGMQPYAQNAMAGNDFLSSGAVLNPDSNPYLSQYASSAVRPVFENLMQNVMPGIRTDAAISGNAGGSRQGIAEGLATQGALKTAGDITSGLYSNAYGQGLGAMTQGLGLAPQTANLGLLPANVINQIGGEQQALQQQKLQNPLQNLSLLAQILGDPTITNEARSFGWGHDQSSGGSFLSGG